MVHLIAWLLFFLTVKFEISFGLSIHCTYVEKSFTFLSVYNCKGRIQRTPDRFNYTVTSINGVHLPGKSNADVQGIELIARGLEHFPSNIDFFFPNLKRIDVTSNSIYNITNEELRPHKFLEDLNFTGNKVTSLDSNLFDGLRILYASFSYSDIKHVGFDIKLPSSAIYFQKNPCIDMYATSVEAYTPLKNALRDNCPPMMPPIKETSTSSLSPKTAYEEILETRIAELEKLLQECVKQNEILQASTTTTSSDGVIPVDIYSRAGFSSCDG